MRRNRSRLRSRASPSNLVVHTLSNPTLGSGGNTVSSVVINSEHSDVINSEHSDVINSEHRSACGGKGYRSGAGAHIQVDGPACIAFTSIQSESVSACESRTAAVLTRTLKGGQRRVRRKVLPKKD